MNLEQAKKRLGSFLEDKILTFNIRKYKSGEWIATCNEIPGIMTCGMLDDITQKDKMMRDAILTAAGIDTKFAEDILKLVNYTPDIKETRINIKGTQLPTIIFGNSREAEYAIE